MGRNILQIIYEIGSMSKTSIWQETCQSHLQDNKLFEHLRNF